MSVAVSAQWSAARVATVAGLLAGAVGIAVMKVGGAGMPVVPPGAVLLVVAAVLVGVTRARWPAALAALVALMEVAATILTLDGLTADALVAVGTAVRGVGVVTALAAATTLLVGRRNQPL